MKKLSSILLIVAIIISIAANDAISQNSLKTSRYLGVKGGYNLSRMNLTLYSKFAFQAGYSGGIVFRHINNRYWATQLEINYTQKGGTNYYEKNYFADTTGLPDKSPFRLKLDYIELPILTVFRLGRKKNTFNLIIGPSVAYIISQKMEFTENSPQTEYRKEIQRRYDGGVNLGLGYTRILNQANIGIEFRYSHSFLSIYEYDIINTSIVNQNQVMSLSLFYIFQLGKKE